MTRQALVSELLMGTRRSLRTFLFSLSPRYPSLDVDILEAVPSQSVWSLRSDDRVYHRSMTGATLPDLVLYPLPVLGQSPYYA
jgi:hypothetical protein